eukprot:CAMPEP_0174942722 /NCGR_PEP_ID=MMETSP1355-20121228/74967_1 /TAXON_ID=464990 /ORGANISM="Hemiselmis tepida, Strain CCMP443" /LENGTH=40 /DNA_ID= /DNA_START= /DNA_END= /DNA_ORIENTATION=
MAVQCEVLFGPTPVVMGSQSFPEWEVDIAVPQAMLPVQYR